MSLDATCLDLPSNQIGPESLGTTSMLLVIIKPSTHKGKGSRDLRVLVVGCFTTAVRWWLQDTGSTRTTTEATPLHCIYNRESCYELSGLPGEDGRKEGQEREPGLFGCLPFELPNWFPSSI